jgi:hypothetical protein
MLLEIAATMLLTSMNRTNRIGFQKVLSEILPNEFTALTKLGSPLFSRLVLQQKPE